MAETTFPEWLRDVVPPGDGLTYTLQAISWPPLLCGLDFVAVRPRTYEIPLSIIRFSTGVLIWLIIQLKRYFDVIHFYF